MAFRAKVVGAAPQSTYPLVIEWLEGSRAGGRNVVHKGRCGADEFGPFEVGDVVQVELHAADHAITVVGREE